MTKERALSNEGVRTNNRAIPWQQSYAYNHPLLFVIPSEAEESAVRHSGAPDLPVYNYLPFVILRACDVFRSFVIFANPTNGSQRPQQSCHPERSAPGSIANRGLHGAESKDLGDTCWQMLLTAFRPQSTPQDKNPHPIVMGTSFHAL